MMAMLVCPSYLAWIAAAGFSYTSPPEHSHAEGCQCEQIKTQDGWCAEHKVGFVSGVRIKSEAFFEALDAHGHIIDPATIRCQACKKNFQDGGYCQECRIGFLGQKAYFSKLTYYVAKGEVQAAEGIVCPGCAEHTKASGWCDQCNVGLVGFRAYKDKSDFEEAARLRTVLLSAMERAEQCLTCALAMINDGSCPRCKNTYRDGKIAATDQG